MILLTLKKNYEFQKTLKRGNWYNGNLISIHVEKNNKDLNYIGIAVSKRVSKSSVKRNRIKRLLREAYRLEEAKIQKGFNMIIAWKSSCPFELANFCDIKNDLGICLKKADLILKDKEEE